MIVDLHDHFGKSWSPVVARIIALEDTLIEMDGEVGVGPTPGVLKTTRRLVRRLRELNTAYPTNVRVVAGNAVTIEWFNGNDGTSLEAKVVEEGKVLWQYYMPKENQLQEWEENWTINPEERLDESQTVETTEGNTEES